MEERVDFGRAVREKAVRPIDLRPGGESSAGEHTHAWQKAREEE